MKTARVWPSSPSAPLPRVSPVTGHPGWLNVQGGRVVADTVGLAGIRPAAAATAGLPAAVVAARDEPAPLSRGAVEMPIVTALPPHVVLTPQQARRWRRRACGRPDVFPGRQRARPRQRAGRREHH